MPKNVALKELKENLAYWAEEASRGEVVQVTKYNKPYMMLVPSGQPGLRVGKNVGKSGFKPVLDKPPKGWKEYLDEDRGEPGEE
ncbi:MAG: hypothetical protein HY540_06335 [Deltaproteobacteria bacterium]|nr:hypothetical protein [Deltaproteobacteria bacterium]